VPGSLREAYQRGGFYVFTREFLEHIPMRLAGPGRFRFVLQPLMATIIGIRAGRADARAGIPPYFAALLSHHQRYDLLRSALASLANLLLLGILMDSLFQWLILGRSYPGAALIVGPVLIAAPYALARTLSNRPPGASRQPS